MKIVKCFININQIMTHVIHKIYLLFDYFCSNNNNNNNNWCQWLNILFILSHKSTIMFVNLYDEPHKFNS